MKTAKAQTNLEIDVTCPYCGESEDVTNELKHQLGIGIRTIHVHKVIKCGECNEHFVIDEVRY